MAVLCIACGGDGAEDSATTGGTTDGDGSETSDPTALRTSAEPLAPRGYQQRGCGLDMNRNGVFGEPEDCHVCDGVTANPDDDPELEDLWYVDGDNGKDGNAGTPESPFRTLGKALSVLDGPDVGAEDIICIRGVVRGEGNIENLGRGQGDNTNTYTVAASGTEVEDWKYSKDPFMIVGWDHNNDGVYPPVDGTAVLSGDGQDLAFLIGEKNDHIELAHFTVEDYGRNAGGDHRGFVRFRNQGDAPSGDFHIEHVYMHDLYIKDVLREVPGDGQFATFNLFTGSRFLHYANFSNIRIENAAGWIGRGSAPYHANDGGTGRDSGPYRWKNLSVTAYPCDNDSCNDSYLTGWKLWGYVSGVEILDSVFDANVVHNPGYVGGIIATQCSQDWMIRNNLFLDVTRPLRVEGGKDEPIPGSDGFCNYNGDSSVPRPVDNIVYDWNDYINKHPWPNSREGVNLEGGLDATRSSHDVKISNSLFYTSEKFEYCIWANVSNPDGPNPGSSTIINNICAGALESGNVGALTFGNFAESTVNEFRQQQLVITENVFVNLDGADNNNIVFEHEIPSGLVMDGNFYNEMSGFVVGDGPKIDLATWKSEVGADESSVACDLSGFSSDQALALFANPDPCAS